LFWCEVVDAGLVIDPEMSYILGLLEEKPVFARSDWVSRDVSLRDALWAQADRAHRGWDVSWKQFQLPAAGSESVAPGRTGE
jgi:hypothetical protein